VRPPAPVGIVFGPQIRASASIPKASMLRMGSIATPLQLLCKQDCMKVVGHVTMWNFPIRRRAIGAMQY
jgi:hypothetical protein